LQLYKGPYFAELGDFSTAAAINFVTKDEVAESFVLAEGGSFDLQRYVVVASPKIGGGLKTLIAGQIRFFDGPFVNPEHLHQYNGFGKISLAPTAGSKLSLSGSVYEGGWHASGQVPRREVLAGRLDRFGAVDPTEGARGTDREKPRPSLRIRAEHDRKLLGPGVCQPLQARAVLRLHVFQGHRPALHCGARRRRSR
ncbi:MAG: hypothetical protein ACREQQ_03635, partial [Candidatus Binatia bacterium]